MNQELPFPILLFDGMCKLCNQSVQWLLLHDKKGLFHYASLQSDLGQKLLQEYGLDPECLDSAVLVEKDKVLLRSDVALAMVRHLGLPWSLAYAFKIIPRPIRDAVYNWVAHNRYRWFGRQDSCLLPRPEWEARFL
jgi:predicted DCC family thiol-disulfide oxidoreductase YuxK